ncbi:hypothetical protein B0H17DRAFT_1215556 [Mycena rosella]|uniref:Uncharacterized protein n=1 Tax=Mycena rosella TaxID=1033263 RepID=A0AAD7G100_MYCRO|nr:hypothetical protein B0H17DRAFT_1215556 [Mycena rosella]
MSLPKFIFTMTAEEVATAFTDQVQGKNVLITGTSMNGIGFETARVIAKYANLVIIMGYNSERLKLSEEAIKKEFPSANIRRLVLDLSSLAAVRKAAAEVNAYKGPFTCAASSYDLRYHVELADRRSRDADGDEPYWPVPTDETHRPNSLPLRQRPSRPAWSSWRAPLTHWVAKSANILTTIELTKCSQGNINAYSLHPGAILTNEIQKEATKAMFQAAGILGPDGLPNTEKMNGKLYLKGLQVICNPFKLNAKFNFLGSTIAAAFDPRFDDTPGAYLCDCVEANAKVAMRPTPLIS